MSKIIKKKLKITGMYCTSCAINIDFDLEDVDGVTFAKTSYAKQECEVEFDQEIVSQKKIIEVIKNLGYTTVLDLAGQER